MIPKILLSYGNGPENYINAVERLGAIAVAEYLPQVTTECDGLLLCGGSDIDPLRYGENVNGSRNIDVDRDNSEFALLDAYVKAGKPVMGICRGCQLINVYFGGTLVQHLDTADDHYALSGGDLVHSVKAADESILKSLYGSDFSVNSRHHQAIKQIGNGLVATAFSTADNVIEAIEHTSLPIIAVQWHPERTCFDHARDDTVDGSRLIERFLEICIKH